MLYACWHVRCTRTTKDLRLESTSIATLDVTASQVHANTDLMLVCIVKIPPARMLEGVDLLPYRLRRDEIRVLPRSLATVLIDWGYAEACADRRRPGNPRIPPKRRAHGRK